MSQAVSTRWSHRMRSPALEGLLLGLGLSSLFYARALWTRSVFIARDILLVYYPVRRFWAQQVLQGTWPGWYPFDAFGVSFSGAMVTCPLLPTNLFYLFLDATTALKLEVLAATVLAFTGAYLLGRRALGLRRSPSLLLAGSYAFSGYLVSMTNNLLYLLSSAPLPLIVALSILLARKPRYRTFAGLALVLGAQGLIGDAQAFVVACLASGLSFLFWLRRPRHAALPILAAGLGALLGAAQIFPGFALRHASYLARPPPGANLDWSMHPLRLLDLLLGPVFVDPGVWTPIRLWRMGLHTRGLPWAPALDVSAIVGLLALVAVVRAWRDVRVKGLVASLLLTFGLCLGRYAALYPLATKIVPFWAYFRYPEKLGAALTLHLCVLGALGLKWILRSRPRIRRSGWWFLATAAAFFFVAALAYLAHWPTGPLLQATWSRFGPDPRAIRFVSYRILLLALETSVFCLLIGLTFRLRPKRRAAGVVASCSVLALLYLTHTPLLRLASPDVLTQTPDTVSAILHRRPSPRLGTFRVFSATKATHLPRAPDRNEAEVIARADRAYLHPLTPALAGLESANDYLPSATWRTHRVTSDRTRWRDYYARLFSVRYLVLPREGSDPQCIPGDDAHAILHDATYPIDLFAVPDPLPRAYLASPRCVSGPEAAFRLLHARQVRPGLDAVIECGDHALPIYPVAGTVRITRYSPDRVEITVDTPTGGALILNDAYAPGWSASVDTRPATIMPANHQVRALWLTPGHHDVVFRYRTPGLRTGLTTTALALLLLLSTSMYRYLRRRL